MSLRPARGIVRALKFGRNGLQCFSRIQFAVGLPIPTSLCSRRIQMKLLDFCSRSWPLGAVSDHRIPAGSYCCEVPKPEVVDHRPRIL